MSNVEFGRIVDARFGDGRVDQHPARLHLEVDARQRHDALTQRTDLGVTDHREMSEVVFASGTDLK